MRIPLALAPLLLLGACSGGGSPTAPPGEDAALNDAAASLEANSADVNAAEVVDEPEGNVGEPEGNVQ